MPFPTLDLIGWIEALGWDTTQEAGVPLYMGPYLPDEPDRLGVLTPLPGPGFQRDGATDMPGFQARIRGPQGGDGSPGAQAVAEADAYRLDALIFGAAYPVTLPSGQVLVIVRRLSGAPAPLLPGPDDGDRFSYVCSYLPEVST